MKTAMALWGIGLSMLISISIAMPFRQCNGKTEQSELMLNSIHFYVCSQMLNHMTGIC